MRAGIAFGSNIGNRLANLKAAREHVSQLPGVKPPILASSVYETEPVGCAPGTASFLNAVLEIDFSGTGEQLLRELRRIEESLGRPPDHVRNAPRTLDLDLLYFGEAVTANAEIELPHPRMLQRRFVLEPLSEIRPDFILPRQSETVFDLLTRLPGTTPLVRVASEW